MAGRLTGKRALVTAAGQGIGRASALAMAREGAEVLATDVDEAALAALAPEGIATRRLDVLDPQAIARAAAEVGGPDVLFNCAGWVHHGALLDTDDAAWARSFDLNVTAMFRVCRAFLPLMVARGGGSIVNMASVVSSIIGIGNRCAYGASKAAVIGLTRSIAADYVGQGIRCNAIAPGTVESPSLRDRIRAQGDEAATRAAFVARQPMRRLGTPEEIASLVVHLASDEGAYTTGSVHVMDGGLTNV